MEVPPLLSTVDGREVLAHDALKLKGPDPQVTVAGVVAWLQEHQHEVLRCLDNIPPGLLRRHRDFTLSAELDFLGSWSAELTGRAQGALG